MDNTSNKMTFPTDDEIESFILLTFGGMYVDDIDSLNIEHSVKKMKLFTIRTFVR